MAALRSSLPVSAFLLSPAARPLRFVGTGGTAGAAQLLLLTLLTRHGWNALLSNGIAFLLAAQLNFALSSLFTWRDRCPVGHQAESRLASLGQRWLLYHGSIALMALLNMVVFALARSLVPTLAASILGIAAGAVGNYLAGDRLVFRGAGESNGNQTERKPAA